MTRPQPGLIVIIAAVAQSKTVLLLGVAKDRVGRERVACGL